VRPEHTSSAASPARREKMSRCRAAKTFRTTRALVPIFRILAKLIALDDQSWMYPTGEPVARARGVQPARLLLIGDAPAAGYGVATHELSVAGHTARALSALIGRGVEVQIYAYPQLTVQKVTRYLKETDRDDFDRYDAIILMLCAADALKLTSPGVWRRQLQLSLALLEQRSAAPTFVTTTADLTRVETLSPRLRFIAGSHAQRLDRETKNVNEARGYPTIQLCSGSDSASSAYEAWSQQIAAAIATALYGHTCSGQPHIKKRTVE
jgi:hypothetical protein